jgi:hypothetical protein
MGSDTYYTYQRDDFWKEGTKMYTAYTAVAINDEDGTVVWHSDKPFTAKTQRAAEDKALVQAAQTEGFDPETHSVQVRPF